METLNHTRKKPFKPKGWDLANIHLLTNESTEKRVWAMSTVSVKETARSLRLCRVTTRAGLLSVIIMYCLQHPSQPRFALCTMYLNLVLGGGHITVLTVVSTIVDIKVDSIINNRVGMM